MSAGFVSLMVLCASVASVAHGDGPRVELSLEECIRIGLEESASTRNARRDQEISERTVQQARSIVLPNLSAGASYTRLDEVAAFEIDGESTEMGSEDNYGANASVSQLLYAGGRVSAALAAGRLTREQAYWARLAVESELVLNIQSLFNDVLLAERTVVVMEESVAHLAALLEQTEQKQRNGAASEFDLITARVRVANERPKLLASENRRDVALAQFARLIGLDKVDALKGELTYSPWDDADRDALQRHADENRPSIQQLRSVAGLREQDVRAARSAGRPELNAKFTYAGANSYQFASFEDDWEWHWNAMLALNWNFWDGGLTRATVGAKQLTLEKARETLLDAVRGADLEVTQAFLDMQHASERVAADRDNVQLAERALKIASERHEAGLATYLEYTDSNVELSRAKLNYLSAVHKHMNSVARLQYAAGILHPAVEERKEQR